MIKAAVFDLDGTLVYLSVNWENLFQEFKQIMHVTEVRPLVDTVSRVDKKTQQEVFSAWDNAEIAVAKKAKPNIEGFKLYKENSDKPKALVTLQGKKATEIILKECNLSFNAVITREDSLSRAEQLLMAAKQLKTPIQDFLFIGNADTDSVAAQKVGCQFKRIQ